MNELLFACPKCAQGFVTEGTAAGTPTDCPRCGTTFEVPSPRMKLACPHCKNPVGAPANLVGVTRSCPACGERFKLEPATATAPAQPPSPGPSPARSAVPEKGAALPKAPRTVPCRHCATPCRSWAVVCWACGGLRVGGIAGVLIWVVFAVTMFFLVAAALRYTCGLKLADLDPRAILRLVLGP